MGTNYPGGTDSFTTPSDPEDTPLSSAGDGTRNLVESIRDLGAAATAIEQNAATKGHNHDGGADGTHRLLEANTHDSSDVDSAGTAKHHTLGTLPHQAAPGNHQHTYDQIIDTPFRECTSTTRPPAPFLGLHIWEQDTNRWRCWMSPTSSDIIHTGTYYTDDFQRVNATALGADWEQHYYPTNPTNNTDGTAGGVMAIPDGQNAQWVFDYTPYQGSGGKLPSWPPPHWTWPYVQGRCIARNVNVTGGHTVTDDQSLTWIAGPVIKPWHGPWPVNPSSEDFYLRMSDDLQSYVRVIYSYRPHHILVVWLTLVVVDSPQVPQNEFIAVYYTTTGVANETILGTLQLPGTDPWSTFQMDFQQWTLTFFTNSASVGRIIDQNQVTAKGASNRGWGIGMTVGRDPSWNATVHCHPTYFNQVTMRDMVYYTGGAIWQLLHNGVVPILRLRQSTAQTLNHAGSLINWDTEDEDNFGFFNKSASQTDIVIQEQGLYDVEAIIQMGRDYFPDAGTVVFLLNGEPTEVRQQVDTTGFGSGGKGSMGQNAKHGQESISIPVSGKLRMTVGDVLQVQAYYTSAQNKWSLIVSYVDPPSKIHSSLKLKWLCP